MIPICKIVFWRQRLMSSTTIMSRISKENAKENAIIAEMRFSLLSCCFRPSLPTLLDKIHIKPLYLHNQMSERRLIRFDWWFLGQRLKYFAIITILNITHIHIRTWKEDKKTLIRTKHGKSELKRIINEKEFRIQYNIIIGRFRWKLSKYKQYQEVYRAFSCSNIKIFKKKHNKKTYPQLLSTGTYQKTKKPISFKKQLIFTNHR